MKSTATTFVMLSSLALASISTTACVVELDDAESAGERDDGIVGGTPTSMRPEIGQFFNPEGGGCTATLIRPDVILTAAHCLAVPIYSGGLVVDHGNGMGNFYPGTDKAAPYGAWAYRAFPVEPGHPVWDRELVVGSKDVALVWLSQPVPAALATPAQIGDHMPSPGQTVTLFGYGCDNRTTKSGSGVKRMRSFPFGPTENNCWGDSGGPVVFGTTGAIFAVVSGHSPQSGADFFGDVVALRSQILDKLAAGPVPSGSSGSVVEGSKKPR